MYRTGKRTSSAAPRRGAAADFVDDRLGRGEVAFALAELTQATGLSAVAARNQLLRLGQTVARVAPRQAFFLIVSPEHRVMGAPPPTWWMDAYCRWLGRPYYLALQSAAAEYGASPQAVQEAQVMTDRPRRDLSIGRVRARFFVKQRVARTPVGQLSSAHAPLRISTPEATALDLVRYAARIGGIERAAETLTPLTKLFRRDELARAVREEGEWSTAQRLGFILERSGYAGLANVVFRQLPVRLSKVHLDTGARIEQAAVEREPRVDRRWAVVVDSSSDGRA